MLFRTWTAVRMILAGRFGEHRRWMSCSFSRILAGVMLRVWVPIYGQLVAARIVNFSFETAYAAIAWLCWVPNLLLALWITATRRKSRMRGEPLVGVTSFVVVVAAEIVRRPGQGYGTGDHLAGILGYFVGTPEPRRTDPIQLTYVLLVWLAGRSATPRPGSASMATAPRLKTAKVPCDRSSRYVLAGQRGWRVAA
jgi:hypothetical protein